MIFLIFFFIFAYYIEKTQNIAKLNISDFNASIIAAILILIGAAITYNALKILPLSERSRILKRKGAYKFVRHPTYSAVMFCFYPAAGLLMKSKPILISTIFVIWIFHILIKHEEQYMIYVFRNEYETYIKLVSTFFPKIWGKRFWKNLKEIFNNHEGAKGYIDLTQKDKKNE